MNGLECPHCHQKAITLWRKMLLGPATSTACAKCGTRVSVPYSAMWTSIPLLVALVAANFAQPIAASIALALVGLLVTCWLHYKFIPLIVK